MPEAIPRADVGPGSERTQRSRRLLLFAVIAATQLLGLAVVFWFPAEPGLVSLADLESSRGFVWVFFSLTGVNLVVGLSALAIAGWLLTPARGAAWGTVGGSLLVLGAALYGTGVAVWAGSYYVAGNTSVLGVTEAAGLLAAVNADDLRLWSLAGPGAGLVAGGTILLSVGLWRAGSVPRWVPVVATTGIIATFVLPTSGAAGLLVEGPVTVSAVAIGWYAWQPRRLPAASIGARPSA